MRSRGGWWRWTRCSGARGAAARGAGVRSGVGGAVRAARRLLPGAAGRRAVARAVGDTRARAAAGERRDGAGVVARGRDRLQPAAPRGGLPRAGRRVAEGARADPALPAGRGDGLDAGPAGPRSRRAAATTTRRTWSATSSSSRAPRRASSPGAGCRTAGASSATDVRLLEREAESSGWRRRSTARAPGAARSWSSRAPRGWERPRCCAARARSRPGCTVLSASGSELEHEFGFGVVRQLLERGGRRRRRPRDRGRPLRHAARALLARRQPGRGAAAAAVRRRRPAGGRSEPALPRFPRPPRAELASSLLVAARPPLPDEDRTILETIAADAATLSPAPLSSAAVAALAGADADRRSWPPSTSDGGQRAARRRGPGRGPRGGALNARVPAIHVGRRVARRLAGSARRRAAGRGGRRARRRRGARGRGAARGRRGRRGARRGRGARRRRPVRGRPRCCASAIR